MISLFIDTSLVSVSISVVKDNKILSLIQKVNFSVLIIAKIYKNIYLYKFVIHYILKGALQ